MDLKEISKQIRERGLYTAHTDYYIMKYMISAVQWALAVTTILYSGSNTWLLLFGAIQLGLFWQ